MTLLEFGVLLLRYRVLLASWMLGFVVLLVGLGLIAPRMYTSTALFAPQPSTSQLASLSGLASQFGLNLPFPGAQVSESPQFYAELLLSHDLLRDVVVHRYASAGPDGASADTVGSTLMAVLDASGRGGRRVEDAIRRFRDRVAARTQSATGVVTLSVSLGRAALSRDVAQRMLDLVNQFNLNTRQSQAAAERRFVGQRLKAARAELDSAEDNLQAFLMGNRRYENSPELIFQHDRLQRRVALRQQVYTSLAESYEQARIEEVRNTPVITVVEPPTLPARPDSRHLGLRILLGLVLGGICGILAAFAADLMRRVREAEPERYGQLRDLARQTLDGLEKLARRPRRGREGGT